MDEVTGNVIRLLDVRARPLSLDEAFRAVKHSEAGAIAMFIGTVRNNDSDRPVDSLGYSAHPSALSELARIADKICADFPVLAMAAVHRHGDLVVGDIAVVVAVACAHRDAAFAAARRLIDDLKHEVPIWKHQLFSDGDDEWVGAC